MSDDEDWAAIVYEQESVAKKVDQLKINKQPPSPAGPAPSSNPPAQSPPTQSPPTQSQPSTSIKDQAPSKEPDEDDKHLTKEESSSLKKVLQAKVVESTKEVEVQRKDPSSPLYSVKSFEELPLKEPLCHGVYGMGFISPSKIQETALPMLLADPPNNMIAQSQSGMGNTAAFVLTMLSHVNTDKNFPQVICLCPTMESAVQTGQVTEYMAKFCPEIKITYAVQGNLLTRGEKVHSHIIIGTPGTLLDWLVKLGAFDPSKIKVFVLNEADAMITTQECQDQSLRISKFLPKSCQMLLFSATHENDVMKFAKSIVPNPLIICFGREKESLENIQQINVRCSRLEEKVEALYYTVDKLKNNEQPPGHSSPTPPTQSPSTKSASTQSPSTKSVSTWSPSTKSQSTQSPLTKSVSTQSQSTQSQSTQSQSTQSQSTKSQSTQSQSTQSQSTQSLSTKSQSTQSLSTKSPSTQSPSTQSPSTQSPSTQSPSTQSPSTQSPSTQSPSTQSPSTQSPSNQSPSTQLLSTTCKSQSAQSSSTKSPSTMSPSTKSPSTKSPSTQSPSTQSPSTQSPSTKSKSSQSSSTKSPSNQSLSTQSPSTKSQSAQSPSTKSPSTQSPSTKSPSTQSPSTQSPSTQSPFTQSPFTQSPSTQSPSTQSPHSTGKKDQAPSKEPDEDEKPLTKAENLLLTKVLRAKLVESTKEVEVQRKDPSSPLYSVKSFEELPLKESLRRGLYGMGFITPSKIQETALPMLLADPPNNMIAQSQIGTGKTATFVLTMLNRVNTDENFPQVICLSPTMELAKQTGQVAEHMAKFSPEIKIAYAIRGNRLARGEKVKSHIIIGTPGTVLDWILKLRAFDPRKIKVFVFNEADVMIATQGHQDQSLRIHKFLPKSCQMLLFSATYENDVMKFAESIIQDPLIIRSRREEESLENIRQFYVRCTSLEQKFEALCNMYGVLTIGQCIVFCHTRRAALWLTEKMSREGHSVALLSGEITFEQRIAVLNRFRDGKEKLLITTNVCPWGIDIGQVNIVVNFDLPVDSMQRPDFETYLHRIDRTGRFGRYGLAINFVSEGRDLYLLKKIEEHFGRPIEELNTNDIDALEKLGEDQ